MPVADVRSLNLFFINMSEDIKIDKGGIHMVNHNPMSKEFQDEAKKRGLSGFQNISKLSWAYKANVDRKI